MEASLADLKRLVRDTENSISVLLAKAPQNIHRGALAERVMPGRIWRWEFLYGCWRTGPMCQRPNMVSGASYSSTNQASFRLSLPVFILQVRWDGLLVPMAQRFLHPAGMLWIAVGSLPHPVCLRAKTDGSSWRVYGHSVTRPDCLYDLSAHLFWKPELGPYVIAWVLYHTCDINLSEPLATAS